MPDWVIYIFIVVLLVSSALLARYCYQQGRGARWIGEKLPGMLGFAVLVTLASLGVDLGRHGLAYLVENPSVIAMRFIIVMLLQLLPYTIGYLRRRRARSTGIIGMD